MFSGDQYKATERRRKYKRDLRREDVIGLNYELLQSRDEATFSFEHIEKLVNSTFTVFIARNCTSLVENYFDGNREAIVCKSANTDIFSETDPLMFVERKYLEAATKTGPSQYEILPARVFSIDF